MDGSSHTARIRALNDALRRFPFPPNGELLLTAGIASLPVGDIAAVLHKMRTFDAFTPDNDPHGEHDFGAFVHNGDRCLWKIDYNATDRMHGSPDPSDPAVTVRVLTVMRADEY